jgi:hypothetical protein
MAWHDQHERIFPDRLRHRMRRAGRLEGGSDLVAGAGFAPRDGAGEFVDPPPKGRDAVHVEHDVGQIDRLAAQQCCNAFDCELDIERVAHLARLRITLEQPPPCLDLARFGKLHAHHAGIAHAMPHRPMPVSNTLYPCPVITPPQPRKRHSIAVARRIPENVMR